MRPAIFLDRDGVIIENRQDYVRSWDDVSFIPNAIAALSAIQSSPYHIILVTNQSAVGRGIITLEQAHLINNRLIDHLHVNGCRIDGVFMCPHAPEDFCTCRKPKPGLLLNAALILHLNLPHSIMIGDAWTDMQAGYAAGVGTNVLVKTGRGQEQLLLPRPADMGRVTVLDSLADALNQLVSRSDNQLFLN